MNSSNSSLDPKLVAFLVLVVGLALAFAIYSFMVKSQQEEIAEKRATLEQKQGTLAEYKRQVAQLEGLREEVASLADEKKKFLAALPKTAQFAQVIKDLKTTVQASTTELKSVNFSLNSSGSQDTIPMGIRPINLDLNLGGKFSQVFNALQRLETQGRFSTINSFDLRVPEAESNDPTLESGLSMLVYTYDPEKDTSSTAGQQAAGEGADGTAPAAAPAPAAPTGGTP